MKTARIVKRVDSQKDGGLIIGYDLNGLFEEGQVYEIVDYGLGEFTIRKIGPCLQPLSFTLDLNTLVQEKFPDVLMTQSDFEK